MPRSLSEVLQDPRVIMELKSNPRTFRFDEAPSALITMVSWPTYTRIRDEDYNSWKVTHGIPTNFPLDGPMSHVLQILSSHLNFTYKQVVPPDKSFGVRAENGSWSGMVRQVHEKEVDFALGPFALISSRYEATDMSTPLHFNTLCIMAGRGSAAIDPWGFMKPFDTHVWTAFFAVMACVCFIHFLFEHLQHPGSNRLALLGQTLFEYIKPPLEVTILRPWRSWQRPLVGSWLAFTFLMASSYGGFLKSMMALRYVSQPIQSIRDLIDLQSVKIVIEYRTAFIDMMQKVTFGDIKELNKVGEEGRYVNYHMSEFMIYADLLRRGDHVTIFDTSTAFTYSAQDFSEHGKCNFYLARETFLPMMYGMVVQKHSPLTPAINARIRRIVEAGLFNHWMKETPNMTACERPPMKVTSNDPMTLRNFGGLTIVWGAGMTIATVIFILEWVIYTLLNR